MRAAAAARPVLVLLLLTGCTERSDPMALELPVAYSTLDAPERVVNTLDDFVDADGCTAQHCSLREAVRAATSGQTIGFSVNGTITLSPGVPLLLIENMAIIGPGAERLTIDASGMALRPHFVIREDVSVRMAGLRLIGGSGEFGGAIQNLGILTLEDLVLENNVSDLGGAVFSTGTLTLKNSTVRANVARQGGGGVFNAGSMTAENIEIHGNELASEGTSIPGGGGIVNAGTMVLRWSRVTSNRVTAGNGRGGGLHNSSNDAHGIVEHTLFLDNEASSGGAINNTETLIIRASELRSNRAHVFGGAIATRDGSLEIENSLIVDNSVASDDTVFPANGSAIINFNGSLVIRHVNVHGNTADNTVPGGAAVSSSGPMQLVNSVVAGNTPIADYFDVAGSTSHSHDIRGNVLGTLAPWMPVPDPSNRTGVAVSATDWHQALGFTPESALDDIFRYHVQAGSPVIDRGVSDGCTAYDVTGTPRPQGAGCDAGAVEYVPDVDGPLVALISIPVAPIAVGSTLTVQAQVDDSGRGGSDVAGAGLSLDGFTTSLSLAAADGAFDEPVELVAGALAAPSVAGIYDLCVRGSDVAGNTGDAACTTLVVYDPSAGFVTGGGWIDSPAGAYAADPGAAGKASFGFVARYRKGADVPDGQTKFVFHAGALTFESTAYEWLVLAGSRAMFKGTGVIRGIDGTFGFMLTAVDGDPDRLRLRIVSGTTEAVLYDNGADQAIGGGSIVVHQK